MLLLRANVLALGLSGIRLEVIDSLLTTPHRQLMPLWPIHQELCQADQSAEHLVQPHEVPAHPDALPRGAPQGLAADPRTQPSGGGRAP